MYQGVYALCGMGLQGAEPEDARVSAPIVREKRWLTFSMNPESLLEAEKEYLRTHRKPARTS